VDGVAIAFDKDDWDHLAMDNVRITMVPAPGAAAVLGLCGLFANRRRR
jgi:MYXO-CTERM domain-containing protein